LPVIAVVAHGSDMRKGGPPIVASCEIAVPNEVVGGRMKLKDRMKKPARRNSARALSRGWIAMGTLAAYTAMGAVRPAIASGKSVPAPEGASTVTLPLKRFDIPAGSLEQAIAVYEKTTGLRVKVVLPQGTLAGFNSPGVIGLYREDDALQRLLDGTGLNYRIEDATTFVVGVQARDTVSVTASVANSLAIEKFSQPLIETPQSISVVPQFVMQDQGVSTLRDTLRNVPGISLAAGEAGAQGDNLTIRGFTARNDIFLDGIRDFGSYYRDSFNYEQVEALEGPAGIQFGRGSTGGVVNQESKVPGVEKFANVQAQFGTDTERRLTADLNSPVDPHLGGIAARLNVMADEGGVAGRDDAEIRRFGIAPSVTAGLGANTHASLSYVHLSENDTPDYGLPWLFNGPAPANHNSYFGFPDANHLRTNDDVLTLRAEHDFSPAVNIHTIARAANYPRNAQITEPQIFQCPRRRTRWRRRLFPAHSRLESQRCVPLHPGNSRRSDHPRQPQSDPGQERGSHAVGPDGAERPLQHLRRSPRTRCRRRRRPGDLESHPLQLHHQQAQHRS
jgi:catecholate siderophore receptor